MPRESAAEKGRTYLTEGRLIVTGLSTVHVSATCRGDGALYRLGYVHGHWSCDCPARTDQCSHLVALRLVVAVDLEDQP